jgi:hypothetical protein
MMGMDMIDIFVGTGDTKACFRVHIDRLCSKIPYFDKMLNSGFKEGQQNQINLPKDEPISFDLLLIWLYTDETPPFKEPGWNAIRLYLLADKLCLEELMN